MKTHVVKSWPQFFDPIRAGTRRHELRLNDRGYQVDDLLELREYDPVAEAYTGRHFTFLITSITSTEVPCAVSMTALHPSFCILSIA